MSAPVTTTELVKQHLIDPELCIRCGTCEATCTQGAVSHDDVNYVVAADKCNYCMDCIAPCPTGSIDNWRLVAAPYALAEQLEWTELPLQENFGEASAAVVEALESEVGSLLETAHAGNGGKPIAPASAAKPCVNLFSRARPALATVQGNYRITAPATSSDVRHIVLSFSDTLFPVLEGQSIGVMPPGVRADGRAHDIRLYSVASARDGEKRNANNVSLTVKRQDGGVASNYLCDLKVGDRVAVTGPFGATFLMPDDPSSNILMVCTGTGSAPFRAFTERRRRAAPRRTRQDGDVLRRPHAGRAALFRSAAEECPRRCLKSTSSFRNSPDNQKEYVQDRMRVKSERIADLLTSAQTHVYICGLKGMEHGVEAAFAEICRTHGLDWKELKPPMRAAGRYHVETY